MKNSGEKKAKELTGSRTIHKLKIANILRKIPISGGSMMELSI